MYDINTELRKIDNEMIIHAYDLDATKQLAKKVLNGYNTLQSERLYLTNKIVEQSLAGEETIETATKLKNVTDFIWYLEFRRTLINERLCKLQSVHPSRINKVSRTILPWNPQESLLSW